MYRPTLQHPRPFRRSSTRELFLLAVQSNELIRAAIAHELDCRCAQRDAAADPLARRAAILGDWQNSRW